MLLKKLKGRRVRMKKIYRERHEELSDSAEVLNGVMKLCISRSAGGSVTLFLLIHSCI